MRFLNGLLRMIATTKNFYCPILVYLGFIDQCYAKLFNGDVIRVSRKTWSTYWDRITFYSMKKKLSLEIINYSQIKIKYKGRNILMKIPWVQGVSKGEIIRKILEIFILNHIRA